MMASRASSYVLLVLLSTSIALCRPQEAPGRHQEFQESPRKLAIGNLILASANIKRALNDCSGDGLPRQCVSSILEVVANFADSADNIISALEFPMYRKSPQCGRVGIDFIAHSAKMIGAMLEFQDSCVGNQTEDYRGFVPKVNNNGRSPMDTAVCVTTAMSLVFGGLDWSDYARMDVMFTREVPAFQAAQLFEWGARIVAEVSTAVVECGHKIRPKADCAAASGAFITSVAGLIKDIIAMTTDHCLGLGSDATWAGGSVLSRYSAGMDELRAIKLPVVGENRPDEGVQSSGVILAASGFAVFAVVASRLVVRRIRKHRNMGLAAVQDEDAEDVLGTAVLE